jgi:hypothetical protein
MFIEYKTKAQKIQLCHNLGIFGLNDWNNKMIDENKQIVERPFENRKNEYAFKWHELYLNAPFTYGECIEHLNKNKYYPPDIMKDKKKMIELHKLDNRFPEDVNECYGIIHDCFDY